MSELTEGLQLGSRFYLLRRLGGGGAGDVWLADDRELNRQIALKVLQPGRAAEELYRRAFADEFHRIAGLSHPGVVRIYDLHDFSEYLCFSMEYLPGNALTSLRGAPWPEIVRAILPITDTLEYVHRAGVIHRDIKSSNVIYSANGQPVLTDFGLALPVDTVGPGLPDVSLPSVSPQQLSGAAAAVSDDVYGFGALLYELVSGQPLFHPDLSRQRVLTETPPRLDTLTLPVAVPPELVGLVSTMLQKQTLRRPQSIAAVRSALESLAVEKTAEDIKIIEPRRRPSATNSNAVPSDNSAPLGKRHWGVLGGIAALVVVLLVVVLWLPAIVADKEPSSADSVLPVEPEGSVAAPVDDSGAQALADDPEARRRAEALLGDLLAVVDDLNAQAVEQWGGDEWRELVRLSESADESFKDRDYAMAVTGYSAALLVARELERRVPLELQAALDAGNAALQAASQQEAVVAFELALAIAPRNQEAQRGLARAKVIDQVLALMNSGKQAETDRNWKLAINDYEQALKLDPEWQPARESLQRARAAASGERYSVYMSDGFAALSAKQYAGARDAFNNALKERPGDEEAAQALKNLAAEEKLAGIRQAMARAKIAVATENWQAAVSAYDEALKLDAKLASAIDGRKLAADRLDLHTKLEYELTRAETFNDQRAWERANGVLQTARAVSDPGAVLQGQIMQLDSILVAATIPVSVNFRSDGVTSVVIYKVGKLGRFESRTMELRPGKYTIVGSRPGFRDVRKTLLIEPGVPVEPVILECKEPI